MFKKLLASIGIGNASVDTRLYDDTLVPGEMVKGEVVMRGGDVAQDIDSIYMYLVTHYTHDEAQHEAVLLKHPLAQRFTLEPSQTKNIPFEFQLPYETPLTLGHQRVYLRTGLEISAAIDPTDTDLITVQPHPLMQKVFDALHNLDFQLYTAHCGYNRRMGGRYPFVQEFEFKPYGKYRGRLEELEMIFYLSAAGLEVFLELDKRLHGFAKLLEDYDLNERYTRFRVSNADLKGRDWTAMIDNIISERIRY